MASIMSRCWITSSSLFPHNENPSKKLMATNYSSQAHYMQSAPKLQRPLSPNISKDHLEIRHMESLLKVMGMLPKIEDPMEVVNTIDQLQRFGIDYHFKDEIESMLASTYEDFVHTHQLQNNLFQVSHSFRLLRQAGYLISSDVFDKFIEKDGEFKSSLKRDVKGLLSLYEASYLNTGENVLNKANEFSRKHLASCMGHLEPNIVGIIEQTLKHPCHMTIPRFNARYYLNLCGGDNLRRRDGVVEELARLDFSIVQSLHQSELKQVLSWWKGARLSQELRFARDQPQKWYIWTMTILPLPQFSTARIQLTKVIAFIYLIDDIFDVYGSPEELVLFTQAISRWELSEIERLPNYMQVCFMALYNITHEIAQDVLNETSWNSINSLKESWTRLCNAFLVESKWFRYGHVPKSEEYLRNAMVSSGVHVVMMHIFFFLGKDITKENVSFLESNPPLISCPAKILRLWDDLGSAKDECQEGIDGSYIGCYMKEHVNSSTQHARYDVRKIISDTWLDLNIECFSSQSHFSPDLVSASLNFARMVEVMYSYDEDQNLPLLVDYINKLLFESI